MQLKWRFGKLIDSGNKNEKTQQQAKQQPITPVIPEPTETKDTDSTQNQNNVAGRTNRKTQVPSQIQPSNADVNAPANSNVPADNNAPANKSNNPAAQPGKVAGQPTQQQPVQPEQNYFTGEGDWHLVVGTFEKKSNADKYLKALRAEGLKAEVRYDNEMKYYYIHLPDYSTQDITVEKVMQLRKNPSSKKPGSNAGSNSRQERNTWLVRARRSRLLGTGEIVEHAVKYTLPIN